MIYERRKVAFTNGMYIFVILFGLIVGILGKHNVNSQIEKYSGNPNYRINYSAVESSLFLCNYLIIFAVVVGGFGLIWYNVTRIGIDKMSAALAPKIRKEREIICGSFTLIWHIKEHVIPSYGMLYFTNSGLEYYAYKLSVRRTNFYILFENIADITSKKKRFTVATVDGKKYSFNTEDEAIALSYEAHFHKLKQELKEKELKMLSKQK